jgi:hypothetical protein
MRSLLLARFAVGGDTIENRSNRTLEEFQHQVQSDFLCGQISYSDRSAFAGGAAPRPYDRWSIAL